LYSITTDSFKGYGLHRIFRFVKQAGFDGIEIVMGKEFDSSNSTYVNELVAENNLPVVAVSASPKSSKKLILNAIKFTKDINCQVLVIHPPELLNFKLVSWMKNEIPKIRKNEKIHICLENTDASTFLGILPKYAMNNVNDLKAFKATCLDTSNLASKKIDLMQIYNKLKDTIKHIHISNSKNSKAHLLPSHGLLPLESFLKALNHNKYDKFISLRLQPKELKVGHDQKMIEILNETREYLVKYWDS